MQHLNKLKTAYKQLESWFKTEKGRQIVSKILYICSPFMAFSVVEALNGVGNNTSSFGAVSLILNLLMYAAIFGVLTLVFGERKFVAISYPVLWGFVGLINHYVLIYRNRILVPSDFTSWQTVWAIGDKLSLSIDDYVFHGIFLLFCYILLVMVFVQKRETPRKHWKAYLMGALISSIVATGAIGYEPVRTWLDLFPQQWFTQDNGFLMNFILIGMKQKVSAPEGYSTEEAEDLIEEIGTKQAEDITQPQNIICIMSEAFMDFDVYERPTQMGYDYTPFLHSLKENTRKGWTISPAFGGGTALPEYEFLTWQSQAFLPYETVAYQLYLDHEMPSMVSLAKEAGYTTTAFHPYNQEGWSRPLVYPLIGFDNMIFKETDPDKYTSKDRMLLGLYSDKCDFEDLFKLTDGNKKGKNFIFNVTIQNHIPYYSRINTKGGLEFENTAPLPSKLQNSSQADDIQTYLSLIQYSDEALRELIEHYKSIDEPTMIVFFGDHQPSFASELVKTYYPDKTTQEQRLIGSVTPFIIWTNYDSPSEEDIVVSPSILGSMVAQQAGFDLPALPNLIMSRIYPKISVAHEAGIVSRENGTIYDIDHLPEDLQTEWDKWQKLCYYYLFDFQTQ